MRRLCSALVLLAGLGCLGACASDDSLAAYHQATDEPKPSAQEAEIRTLQQATALAQGEVAWESVNISAIQRDAKSVKWVAKTRSVTLNCKADPDGSNSYCE
jgi:hypothetical protein